MSVRFFNFPPCRALSVLLLVLASVMLVSCARTDSFDWGQLVLFSAISGKVLDQGKPVPGLTLTRTVEWTGDTFIDTTTTDKEGAFAFPVLKRFSLIRQVLPANTHISQSIKANHQGKERDIWRHSKSNYDNNGELFYYDYSKEPELHKSRPREAIADPKKVPITVTCELSTEVRLDPDGSLNLEWFDSRGPKGSLGRYCLVN
jgi:hypothetical protein